MMRFLLFVLASAALVIGGPWKAEADDTQCTGVLAGLEFDNVVVPAGMTCALEGSVVRGNVKALENSRLLIYDSTIGGNVQGDKADVVQVFISRVREYISIKEGGPAVGPPPEGSFFQFCGVNPCEAFVEAGLVQEGGIQIEKMVGQIFVSSSVTKGNIKIEDNLMPGPGDIMLGVGSNVAQNIQVFKNRGPGTKVVQFNTVGESIQCYENDEPFFGGGNTAPNKEGQCF